MLASPSISGLLGFCFLLSLSEVRVFDLRQLLQLTISFRYSLGRTDAERSRIRRLHLGCARRYGSLGSYTRLVNGCVAELVGRANSDHLVSALLLRLLTVNPAERITIPQMEKMDWYRQSVRSLLSLEFRSLVVRKSESADGSRRLLR